MRLVFMGTPQFAVPSLRILLESSHEVVGVVTQPDRPKGRGQVVMPPPVKELALLNDVPVVQPEKMKALEFLECLEAWNPDVIVVTAFGRILPKAILDVPRQGCVNVHGSLLPAYRGAAPIQWAIINGETQTGITTMFMDEGMDTGDILLQEQVDIHVDETAGELAIRLAEVGGRLLVPTLEKLEAGSLTRIPQDDAQASLAPILTKSEGCIDWTLSARQIVDRVRGLSPWPGTFGSLEGQRMTIWQAHEMVSSPEEQKSQPGTITAVGKKEVVVSAGQGSVGITEWQPANKKRMTVEQFLSGNGLSPGMMFQTPS
ncbi:MAG: methionyl-tRNA formyltransferase [Nitrospirae bacterium]|nr:methionyl-tRNA formyltransferase [Nitrospirota bacterium]